MSPPFALQVTVELGDRRRTLGPVELAAALAMPALPGRLASLVLASPKSTAIHSDIHNQPEEGEPTEGKERRRESTDPDMNGSGNESNSISFSDPSSPERDVGGGKGSRGRAEGEGSIDHAVDQIALELAAAFADDKSYRLYRRVASEVPLRTIHWALGIALELEPTEVRRSRAAYFTALVRPHLRARQTKSKPSP